MVLCFDGICKKSSRQKGKIGREIVIEQQSKVVIESFIVVVVIAAGITFPNREQTFNLVLFDFIYKIKNE